MEDTNSLNRTKRRAKLKSLEAKGIFSRSRTSSRPTAPATTPAAALKPAPCPKSTHVAVAGRITAHPGEMGKSMFIDVRDQSGRIQIYVQKKCHGGKSARQLGRFYTHSTSAISSASPAR